MRHIIGITGCSGSGKTLLSTQLKSILENKHKKVFRISTDWFYKTKTIDMESYNFDIPTAFDFSKLINSIKNKETIMLPEYDYINHISIDNHLKFDPNNYDIIIIEGIMLFDNEIMRDIINTKIFVHTDLDVCLARRILRDTAERGRSVPLIIKQWFEFVKPGYINYIDPTIIFADYIFNNTEEIIEENIIERKLLKIINHIT